METLESRNMQLMLEDFYGIDDDESEDFSSTATPRSAPGGSMLDPDSSEFHGPKYMEKLLANSDINELSDIESRYRQEIRSYESNMQTLVYDNYNKFIAATDTIHEMKGRVENMDGDMSQFLVSVGAMKKKCQLLESNLSSNLEQITKLSSIRQMITNLDFLFHLPERLRNYIEQEQYEECVRDYKDSLAYLRNHAELKSFKKIEEETQVIVHDLRDHLKTLVRNDELEDGLLMDYTGLLLQLGENPEPLSQLILASRRQAFSIHAPSFLADYLTFAKAYTQLFSEEGLLQTMDAFTKDIFSKYFQSIHTQFHSISLTDETLEEGVNDAVPLLESSIIAVKQVSKYAPGAGLCEQLETCIAACTAHLLNLIASKTASDSVASILDLAGVSSSKTAHFDVEECGRSLLNGYNKSLHIVSCILTNEAVASTLSPDLAPTSAHAMLQKSFHMLDSQMLCGMQPYDDSAYVALLHKRENELQCHPLIHAARWDPKIVLQVYRVTRFLCTMGSDSIMQTAFELFPRAGERLEFHVKKRKQAVQRVSDALLHGYVELRVDSLSAFFEEYLASEVFNESVQTPLTVSRQMQSCAAQFSAIARELQSYFPELSRRGSGSMSVHPRPVRQQSGNEADIERIFSEQVKVFTSIRDGTSAFSMLVRGFLKACSEILKCSGRISTNVLQQIQVDLFHFHASAAAFSFCGLSDEAENFNVLMDEALSSAASRVLCLNGSSLEPHQVETIAHRVTLSK